MSEIVAYQAASLTERKEYAKTLAAAGDLIPKGLWAPTVRADGGIGPQAPSAGKILLVIETGSMLGLHPMAALQSIDVVEGRATLSAKLMAGMIRSKGHRLEVERTGTIPGGDYKVKVTATRADSGETAVAEWDIPRAMRAGLVQSYNRNSKGEFEVRARGQNGGIKPWEAHAESMPWNRAISDVGRQLFSDVLFGLYSTEEISDSGPAIPVDEPVPEPSEDWAAQIEAAATLDALSDIQNRLRAAGEGTDRLRAQWAARFGALEREANIEDAVEVNDERDDADDPADAGETEPASDPVGSGNQSV